MDIKFLIVLPFIILLLSISFIPLINKNWWEKKYPVISISLAIIVVLFYFIVFKESGSIYHALEEYFSFIVLLFSLYVISGGVFFNIKGKATPIKNVLLLLAGAVIANLFGTTGASILLIRPYINSNKYHLRPYHIVFFIFLVSNIGGSLTPIGDPPLFIGYLKGIPFFWITERMFLLWIMTVIYLLIIFYIIDNYYFHKIRKNVLQQIEHKPEEFKFMGIKNVFFLLGVVGCVFITKPMFLREFLMLSLTFLSYKFTHVEIHKRNKFSFDPIKEVAILFIGIFITMVPALELISNNSKSLGINTPSQYFWFSGILTSFLDNAPTYLNFLTASMAAFDLNINMINDVLKFTADYKDFIISISTGSVFFGAMTYIGNGPNFMIKSISESKGVKMPGFLQYIYKYSIPVLIPFFLILWLLFFR
ncbi:MAG TPA: sodium:proton antiporter [Ignavibacteria bacterium]